MQGDSLPARQAPKLQFLYFIAGMASGRCPFKKKKVREVKGTLLRSVAAGVAASRQVVVVGTDDGKVIVFDVRNLGTIQGYDLHEGWEELYSSGEAQCWGDFTPINETKVGKKPVTELVIEHDTQMLFATCDGVVTMLSLDKLESGREMKKLTVYEEKRTILKGVISTSASTYRGDEHRLAAATKKRVYLYQYTTETIAPLTLHDADAEAFLVSSRATESLLKVHLDGALLCICTKDEYRIADLNTCKVTLYQHDKRPNSSSSTPIALSTPDNLLIQLDIAGKSTTKFLNRLTGEATSTEVTWDAPLEHLYVPSRHHMMGVTVLKQRTGASIIIYSSLFSKKWPAPAETAVEGVSGIDDELFFISGSSIWQLSQDPYLAQLIELAKTGTPQAIEEGITILNNTYDGEEGKDEAIQCYMHKVAGFAALDAGDFDSAFKFFSVAHGIDPEYIDPREILSLFGMQKNLEAYMEGVRSSRRNVREVLQSLPPRERLQQTEVASVHLYKYLHEVRVKCDDPLLIKAKYRAIDTALLLKYLEIYKENTEEADAQVQEILRDGNCLEFGYCAGLLKEKKKYRCLALLKVHNGLVAEALQMLHEMGNGGDYQEEGQNGVSEACLALKHCNGEDSGLVLEYLPWVLRHNPQEAVKTLLLKRDPPLDTEKVLQILAPYPDDLALSYLEFLVFALGTKEKKYHTQLALLYISCIKALMPPEMQGVMSCIPAGKEAGLLGDLRRGLKAHLNGEEMLYDAVKVLSHLNDAGFLAECVVVYAMLEQHELALKVLLYDINDSDEAIKYCEVEYNNSLRKHIVGVLSSKFNSINFTRAPSPQSMKPGSPTRSMSPRVSDPYDQYDLASPTSAHANTDADINLDLEQAMARPDEFFALHMIPPEDKHGNTFVGIKRHNQYLYQLLRHCFYPEKGEVSARHQNVDHALRILASNPKNLNPIKVLKLIPNGLLSVCQVKQYLVQVFRRIETESSDSKILHHLALGNKHKHEVDRATLLDRCVLVDPTSRHCVICSKRLGTSGIAVYPNLEVAHYQCQLAHSRERCPKTDLPFFVDVHNVRPRAKYWGAK
eukprot:TRINITY_DN13835_c0_g1_i1.p1 TRINITY_DN13835_c0_g1~~TRINITY_DN13835_c0_g1_i1.p1  ORF type:complete len:1070 (+),score=379.89 TRINITY_DN13835_c0_g1_i1:292-3501(+)